MLINLTQDEGIEKELEIVRTSYTNIWKIIPVDGLRPVERNIAHRLNSLGSLFYFAKVVLRKHRLSNGFHFQYCQEYECDHLKEVFEIPRDHFKTTIAVCAAIWWALPFKAKDEAYMRHLGYDDRWILWMKRAHDQNTRTLIAMETIKNSWKIGSKVNKEYKENDFFRGLFHEIMPDSSCEWNKDSMTQMRNKKSGDANQGEGTFDITGVDAAIQSRHYNRYLLDDLFGKKALNSDLVAESTWDWFKLLVGTFDNQGNDPDNEPDEIVNGNRWGYRDLNFNIREKIKYFNFHTHSAEGGCCPKHPAGVPIFPEEWSLKKLARRRDRLGDYFYSCQYLNSPIPPGGSKFQLSWLKHFTYTTLPISHYVPPKPIEIARAEQDVIRKSMGEGGLVQVQKMFGPLFDGSATSHKKYMAIRHQVIDGKITKDIPTNHLKKVLWIDPNHSGEKGRARHAVVVTGHDIIENQLRIYFLEMFIKACDRSEVVNVLYELGEKWKIRDVWTEISAGQTWLKTLLEMQSTTNKKLGKWYFDNVYGFRDNRAENAKADRIDDSEPFYRNGQIYVCDQDPAQKEFIEEYKNYPHYITRDSLDIVGHICQNIDPSIMSNKDLKNIMIQQQKKASQLHRNANTGY